MRIGRARYLILATLFIAVSWIGYWIGYITSRPLPSENILNSNVLSVDQAIHKQNHDIPVEKVEDISSKHVQGIHRAHVALINDHLHPQQAPPKAAVKALKEDTQEGVEWKHLLQPKQSQNSTKIPSRKSKMAEKFNAADTHYAVVHAGLATKVHGKIHEKIPTLPDTVPKEAYIFKAERYVQTIIYIACEVNKCTYSGIFFPPSD